MKKIAALLFATTIVVGVLAGCSDAKQKEIDELNSRVANLEEKEHISGLDNFKMTFGFGYPYVILCTSNTGAENDIARDIIWEVLD